MTEFKKNKKMMLGVDSFMLSVEIFSHSGAVYSGEADSVKIPGSEGEMGILPGHAAIIAALKPGLCEVKRGSEVFKWDVSEGFAEVEKNVVKIAVKSANKR